MSTVDLNPKVSQICRRVRLAYEELTGLLDGQLAGLDEATLYQVPAENEWTLMQSLAHLVELMPYWADEIAKLVEQPGQNFGRTMEHEGRLSAIREHGTDKLAQIKAALPGSYTRLEEVLRNLSDSQLELTAHHSKFKERTLEWFVAEFVTNHLDNHLKQLKTALATVS